MSFQKLAGMRIRAPLRIMAGFIFLLLFFPLLIAPGLASPEICSVKFDSSANTLSANLADADISEVSEMLSRQARISILLDNRITSHKLTLSFQNMPLEDGIRRLFGPSLSTALIFSKEKTPSGKAAYRLDTAKIFRSGSRLSDDFKVFERNESPGKNRVSLPESDPMAGSASAVPVPRQSGSARYSIMQAQKHLSAVRSRNDAERSHANRTVMSLRAELARASSPDERSEIAAKLRRAEGELSCLRTARRKTILQESKALAESVNAASAETRREKIAQRRRLSERQRHHEAGY